MTAARAREEERAERLQLLANQVTLARMGLVAALALLVAVTGGIGVLAALTVVAIWVSDVVDGPLARMGRPPGVRSRPEGQALDPVVDDFAYAIGFAVLFGEGLVPFAFLALVIATRCTFTLVRIAGMAMGESFARPRASGKAMGVGLGLGQIALFAAAAGLLGSTGGEAFNEPLTWAMGVACAVGLLDFLHANRAVVAAALLSRSRAQAQDPAEPRPDRRIAFPARPTPLRSAAGKGRR